jgi:hypothetical protein
LAGRAVDQLRGTMLRGGQATGRRSAFTVHRSAFGVRRSAFGGAVQSGHR